MLKTIDIISGAVQVDIYVDGERKLPISRPFGDIPKQIYQDVKTALQNKIAELGEKHESVKEIILVSRCPYLMTATSLREVLKRIVDIESVWQGIEKISFYDNYVNRETGKIEQVYPDPIETRNCNYWRKN